MSSKTKPKVKTQYEILESIRRDWDEVYPATKVFEDKRKKRERKYPKQAMEEYEDD